MKNMATLIGLVGGVVLLALGISIGGSLVGFYDLPSIFITFGGSIMALMVQFPFSQFSSAIKCLHKAFFPPEYDHQALIDELVEHAKKARRDGILALENAIYDSSDPFLQRGIRLVVDGTDPELVRNILESEIALMEERHRANKAFYDSWGILAPGFGMIGTVIGLIQMLGHLQDVAKIGPAMAVALITTFYGAVWANLFCIPVAGKLAQQSSDEAVVRELILEGVLAIQAGENPRLIEEKLTAYLTPGKRHDWQSAGGGMRASA